jgi:hypothetical protein
MRSILKQYRPPVPLSKLRDSNFNSIFVAPNRVALLSTNEESIFDNNMNPLFDASDNSSIFSG